MSQLLSKDEVDALLRGVDDGAIAGEAGPAASGRGVVALDLTSPERSVRGRWPGVEMVVDRFARSLRTTLGTFLGCVPTVSVPALELVKFEGVAAGLPEPASLQLFRMPPLRGQGMLVIGPPLAAIVLEGLFGGRVGRRTPLAEREFSLLEQRALERLGSRVLRDLQDAWRPLAAIEFTRLRSETNPQLAPIAAPAELVLRLDVAIAVDGGEPVPLTLCVPNAALDPVRPLLEKPHGVESEATGGDWGEQLRAHLADTALEVVGELGCRRMRMSEVLALRVGDLFTLPTGREGPIVVRVEGRPLFLGAPGVSGGSNAVRITTTL